MLTLLPFLPADGAIALSSVAVALVMLLKITLVLLVALAVTGTMQRTSAGARHLVWLVALGALLLLPPLAVWAPLPVRVLPATAHENTATFQAAPMVPDRGERGRQAERQGTVAPSEAAGVTSTPSATPRPLGRMLLGLWGVVALALLARLGYGAWSVRRIVRRARALELPEWQAPLYEIADRLGLEAAPRLLRSEEVKMPFAAGLVSATIVLPAESDRWSADRRSAVLIHELGHVRRRDLVGHTVSRVVCALYWFHPLVWSAARSLRAESERACDDLALEFGARPSEYAEHLLEIVTCVRDHNTPAVALAMAHRKEFEGRMLAILNPELRRRGPSRTEALTLVGSLAALALLVGAAAPMPRTVAPIPEEPNHRAVLQDSTPQSVALAVRPAPPHNAEQPVSAIRGTPAANPDPRPMARPQPSGTSEQADEDSANVRAEVLARTLRGDQNAGVRRVAAWGLARYARSDVAADALIAALTNDADAGVREMSAWALAGARRSAAAGKAIGTALQRDRDASVRATAAWAAGSIGEEAAVPALLERLKDADPEVREIAAWSIGACHPDAAPAPLIAALGDADRDVRESVTWALYTIHDPAAASAIESAFAKESDAEVRTGMIKAIGRMGEQSVALLQRLVTSPDSAVRAVAVTALADGDATGPWPWPRPEPRPFP